MDEGYYDTHCYLCNDELYGKMVAFTMEFDAFICEDCFRRLKEGNLPEHDVEGRIIRKEFFNGKF